VGNFVQTYSMVGLITGDAASKRWEQAVRQPATARRSPAGHPG
jgi:hypothetical protein